jgi:hypothetical protein
MSFHIVARLNGVIGGPQKLVVKAVDTVYVEVQRSAMIPRSGSTHGPVL